MLLKPCDFTVLSWARVTIGLPQAVSSAPIESNVLPRFQPGCMAATSADAVGAVPAYETAGIPTRARVVATRMASFFFTLHRPSKRFDNGKALSHYQSQSMN